MWWERWIDAGLFVLVAAVPAVAPEQHVFAQWGLAGVVIAYTLWRDHHREQRQAKEKTSSETWIKETLLAALASNTAVMQRLERRLGGVDTRAN